MSRFYGSLVLALWPVFIFAQTVSGVVTDASTDDPIIGANILRKGTGTGTISDIDGRFELRAEQGDTLIFSYTGYRSVQRVVDGTVLNIEMGVDQNLLEEIVVIGYGTTTVKDATGSVASLSERNFNRGNIVTPENLLVGRLAGVSVTTDGAPGSGSTIRIRGGSSLGASNDPLIVVNGLPISNSAVGGSRSALSTINPNDIASITVLKDASATAIYGSRAANGVIIITTKEAGDNLGVQYNLQTGISTLPNKIDVFSADEFRELVAEQRPDLVPQLGDANTDWQDEIYENVFFHNHNLALEGRIADNFPARVSLGYTDQPGIRLTSEFERKSASVNLVPRLLDGDLIVTVNANAALENNRFAAGQEGNAITFDPTQPVYDPNSPFGGFFEYYNDNGDGVLNSNDLVANSPGNPVAALLQRSDRSDVNRYYGNINVDYRLPFFRDMRAVINAGIDDASSEGRVLVDENSRTTQPNGQFLGSESEYTSDQRNVLFDSYLAYNKELDRLRMELTGGYSYQRFEAESWFSGELRNDLPSSEPVTSRQTDLVLIGFFGRADFSFADKYLLTASVRRDATSRFSENNRWGTFPAVALAWRLREDLFPASDFVTNLKLRLGWGVTGQQDIGSGAADLYLARYGRGLPNSQYIFGGQVIPVAIPQFRNENLKWEETTTWNVGLDFGLLADRLNGTVEYFFKDSEDLLAFAAISDGSNFSNSGFQNIGNFTSQGVELSLDYNLFNPASRGDFSWNVSFNATVIKTKIEELALGQDVRTGGIAGGVGGTVQLHRVGFAPYKFFVYKQVYDEDGNPIEGAYVDLNGDNIINDSDRYLHRNNQPELTLGFQSQIDYRNFDLNFNLRGSFGQYIYNNVNSARAQYDLIQNIQVLANLPTSVRESNFNTTPTVILSDYYMENGSFLKLDNITLGYTFPAAFNGRADLRLTAGVQNALVFTGYSGLDPEIFSGIDNTIYPRARTFLLGANLKF